MFEKNTVDEIFNKYLILRQWWRKHKGREWLDTHATIEMFPQSRHRISPFAFPSRKKREVLTSPCVLLNAKQWSTILLVCVTIATGCFLTKEVFHIISFEPISVHSISKSFNAPSVKLVRTDVIGTFWRATTAKLYH